MYLKQFCCCCSLKYQILFCMHALFDAMSDKVSNKFQEVTLLSYINSELYFEFAIKASIKPSSHIHTVHVDLQNTLKAATSRILEYLHCWQLLEYDSHITITLNPFLSWSVAHCYKGCYL